MKKRILITFFVILSIATIYACQSKQPIDHDNLDFLIESLNIKQHILNSFAESLQENVKDGDKEMAELTQEILDHLTSAAVMDKIKAIYAKNLSPQTINDMANFYRSPACLEFNATADEVASEVSELLAQESQHFADQIAEDVVVARN